MRNARKLRFADLGTGLSAMVGTASLLLANLLHAGETCSTPVGAAPQSCDHIYQQAADRLRNLNPGGCNAGCGPAAPVYAAPAPSCGPAISPDAVFNGCGNGSTCNSGTCNSGCNSGCDDGGCLGGVLGGELGEPWKLSEMENFDYGGWFDFGYQSDPDGAFTQEGEQNKLNLSQLYVYVQKTTDGSKGLDVGFRFDALYGTDGNDAQSFGNTPGNWDFQNGFDHGIYEIALPQAYGEIAYGNLTTKIGHFYTTIGYEVVTSPDNFFYSRQLTFWNSEPFTHTGTQSSYKVNDQLTVNGGFVFGWDTGFDRTDNGSSALLGFTYAINDKMTFIYQGSYGNFGTRGDGNLSSIILSTAWTDKFTTVNQFAVLGTNLDTDFAADGVAGDSTGVINYAFYQLTDRVKAGARSEWFKADGTSYHTLSYGVNVRPTANIVMRPEVRHMWSEGNNSQLFNETVFGTDVIIKF